jgi:hypothetical protein
MVVNVLFVLYIRGYGRCDVPHDHHTHDGASLYTQTNHKGIIIEACI